MQIKIYLVLIFSVLYIQTAAATTSIRNFSVNEGLIHKTVLSIFTDSEGFVWIGTTNGISRFDGENFKNFTLQTNTSLSSSTVSVKKILEAPTGELWMATNVGILIFDKENERTTPVLSPSNMKIGAIDEIVFLNNGEIWCTSKANGLLKVIYNRNNYWYDQPAFLKERPIKSYYFSRIIPFKDKLFINCLNELTEINLSKSTIKAYPYPVKNCFALELSRYNNENLIFQIEGYNIYYFNTKTKQFTENKNAKLLRNIKGKTYSPMSNIIGQSFALAGKEEILFSDNNKVISVLIGLSNYKELFADGPISILFRDAKNNLYVGTHNKGIYVVINKKLHLKIHLTTIFSQ